MMCNLDLDRAPATSSKKAIKINQTDIKNNIKEYYFKCLYVWLMMNSSLTHYTLDCQRI
jgi:hypothetical protein